MKKLLTLLLLLFVFGCRERNVITADKWLTYGKGDSIILGNGFKVIGCDSAWVIGDTLFTMQILGNDTSNYIINPDNIDMGEEQQTIVDTIYVSPDSVKPLQEISDDSTIAICYPDHSIYVKHLYLPKSKS